jgi:hypothetical protein
VTGYTEITPVEGEDSSKHVEVTSVLATIHPERKSRLFNNSSRDDDQLRSRSKPRAKQILSRYILWRITDADSSSCYLPLRSGLCCSGGSHFTRTI